MSRSFHRVMFSSAGVRFVRITRARPQTFSQPTGFRLWGMADDPFWPVRNGSSTSRISVRCRFRISVAMRSRPPARIASAAASSACRSR